MVEQDHDCKQEVAIALLKQNINSIKKDTERIIHLLDGNSGKGLVTKTELHAQSLRRVWWWLGSISLIAVGAIINFFKR